jgi:enamine deaminase RidA (YjgF/YER057c/UK114 family)
VDAEPVQLAYDWHEKYAIGQAFRVGDVVHTSGQADIANFPAIVEMRKRYFSPPWPADTIVQVASLALPELMFEIEAQATVAT